MQPKFQSDSTINIIRGKNLVGKADKPDVDTLLSHIDALEMFLDDHDEDDTFGTEAGDTAPGLINHPADHAMGTTER